MIDKFCNWITEKIKGKMPEMDEEKEAVINFGVRLLFGEIPKIIALFIIGFLLQIGWYSLLIYFLLAPYRSSTGGFHLKTHWGCMLSSIVLYIVPILMAKYVPISQEYIIYIMTGIIGILSSIFIFKYAPADTENIPILSKQERKTKRIKSYISLGILLAIIIFVPDKIVSYMLLYGMFLQDLTLTPIAYKLTKNKYSYEVYTEETA
ncbi:MAG: accessory gene regulator B family protein [Clostridia bacterium]|nr:accessory gene regulator B family protein [Clostridia bacterium]